MNEAIAVFILLGFLIGIIYDFFRFFRLVFKNKRAVFLLDFLFFIVISPIIFIFLLSYNNGQVRAFYFTAILFGYLVYILTFYRLTGFVFRPIALFFQKILKKALKSLKKGLQYIKKLYYNMLSHSPLRIKTVKKDAEKKKSGDINEEDFSEFNT